MLKLKYVRIENNVLLYKKLPLNVIFLMLFIFNSPTGFGQTLFFDQLENNTWATQEFVSDSTLTNAKEIQLHKLRLDKDSLKTDVIIWNFSSGILRVSQYDPKLRSERLIWDYYYEVSRENGTLKILLKNYSLVAFRVGITSNGDSVLLKKIKLKIKK